MKKIFSISVFIFCFFLFAYDSEAADIVILYNKDAEIVNTHYNAPGNGSGIVIITVDLKFKNGRYIKCIEQYFSRAAAMGFSRISSPSSIEFEPGDVKCAKIK